MRFSRDNILISNRPGEYANAQKFFGLNNTKDKTVSLWLVPTKNTDTHGAPIGFTSNENSRVFLERAISAAEDRLNNVSISSDGKDVAVGKEWASQKAFTQLGHAITVAKEALRSASSTVHDYQTYLLYLNLHGSDEDIGARYSDYSYVGFDNQIKMGSEGQP